MAPRMPPAPVRGRGTDAVPCPDARRRRDGPGSPARGPAGRPHPADRPTGCARRCSTPSGAAGRSTDAAVRRPVRRQRGAGHRGAVAGAAHVTFVDERPAALAGDPAQPRRVRPGGPGDGRRHTGRAVARRPRRPRPGSTWRSATRPTPSTAGTALLAALPADLVVVESDGPVDAARRVGRRARGALRRHWVGFLAPPGTGLQVGVRGVTSDYRGPVRSRPPPAP